MFYCAPCGQKNRWPEGFRTSYGPCEICEDKTECFDVPSSALPPTLPEHLDFTYREG